MVLICAGVSAKKKTKVFYDSKSNIVGITGSYNELSRGGINAKFFNNNDIDFKFPSIENPRGYSIRLDLEHQNVGKKEQQVIIDFVKWFCAVDLENSLYQFGQRYNELQDKAVAKKVPRSKVFDKLPETFDKNEVRIKLQREGVRSSVKQVIYLWHQSGLIEKHGDTFKKIKKS